MPRTKNLPRALYAVAITVTPEKGEAVTLRWDDVQTLVGERAMTAKAFGEAVQEIMNIWQRSLS